MRLRNTLARLLRWAAAPVGAAPALATAFLIGAGYLAFMLGPEFFDTSSAYWQLPRGYLASLVDTRTILSGYDWFVQDAWRWPLMHIAQVDPPAGTSAALMDTVPVLALAGKIASGLFGAVNPYPAWQAACFGLNAAGLAALVRGLGQRSLVAAVAAGAMAAMQPLMHLRFGHFGLSAQWTFLFALAAYASAAAGRLGALAASSAMIVLSLLAMGSTIYLYPMTAAVGLAYLLQAGIDRRMPLAGCAAGVALLLLAGVFPLWALGLLGRSDIAVQTFPFGYASMNLLAPFWPQTSGLFTWTGIYALTRGSIGGTQGQYEAMCYLGGGMLLLLGACLCRPRKAARLLRHAVGRHTMLVLALAALTLWALSNKVYAGSFLLLSYPLPDALLHSVLGWFRYSGRLFWPVAWTICALGIAGVLSLFRPRVAVPLVVLAIGLQWIDLSIWRTRLTALVADQAVSAFGTVAESAGIERDIARFGRARVVPAMVCLDAVGDSAAAAEMQLLAARQNARMDNIFKARSEVDCVAERAAPLVSLAGRSVLLLLTHVSAKAHRDETRAGYVCHETLPGTLCLPQ